MKENIVQKLDAILYLENDPKAFKAVSREVHPALLAERMSLLELEKMRTLMDELDTVTTAWVFSHLSKEKSKELAALYSDSQLADIIEEMPHDDRVDLIRQIPMERRGHLLKNIEKEEDREDILRLSRYSEDKAGALMTSDFVKLEDNLTVAGALTKIRRVAKDRETIYYAYITDKDGLLKGMVSLKKLILSPYHLNVTDIMFTEAITAHVNEHREIVANRLSEYDLIAIPVLDEDERLVGIITFDDVMDVRQEEATMDFHKMGSVGLIGVSLKDAPISTLFLKRVPWLLILVFMNIFSGAGIAFFEETIEAVVALVFFLPLLIDSGGNAGSQASTLMVRALATGDVRLKDWFKLFGKEIFVAIAIGIAMGIAVSCIGFYRGGMDIAVVVSVTMICCVLVGSLLGMSLPFLLQKMKFDPATASAPLITSLADIAGVLMYFSIATWYLGIGS